MCIPDIQPADRDCINALFRQVIQFAGKRNITDTFLSMFFMHFQGYRVPPVFK